MNKEQIAFEKVAREYWKDKAGPFLRECNDPEPDREYQDWDTQIAWEFWQARASLDKQDSLELVKLLEASERMMFLHMCEQEGITCGQPKPSDWLAAVDYLGQALEPFRKDIIATEETNPNNNALNKSYTENDKNVSEIVKEIDRVLTPYDLAAPVTTDWIVLLTKIRKHLTTKGELK